MASSSSTKTQGNRRWTSQDAVQAIIYWTRRYGFSPQFLQFALAVAYGESGMNPYAVGDHGKSFGIYQFYTGGGRGTTLLNMGYTIEDLYNPWVLAEHNLKHLHSAYMRFGGDSGWQSNPAYVLRNGWKYGQGSIWPTDGQISSALSQTRSLMSSQPALFDPNAPMPDVPPSTPSKAPADDPGSPSTSFNWESLFPRMNSAAWVADFYNQSGGQDPAAAFLQEFLGGAWGAGADPAQAFLSEYMDGSSGAGAAPQSSFLASLFAPSMVSPGASAAPVLVPGGGPGGSIRPDMR